MAQSHRDTPAARRRKPYTTGQAARELERSYGLTLSRRTVARLCDDGEIESYRTPGGDRRITATALRSWGQQFASLR